MTEQTSWKKKVALFLVPKIYKLLIVGSCITCRQKWIGTGNLKEIEESGEPAIYSLWHENIAIGSWVLKKRNLVAMVSQSRDGELIARALETMGFGIVRGSSSKGGARALLNMIRLIKKGQSAIVTPDGPRGPSQQLQEGVLTLAQKTGKPLVPLHMEASRQWRLGSWDRHKIPKPFSTIVIRVGTPQRIAPAIKSDSMERIRKSFEEVMRNNTQQTIETIKQLQGPQ